MLLVIIATYNEIDSLPNLIESIFELLPDVKILVIDDNSPDGTGQWASEEAKGRPHLTTIIRPTKSGLGSAAMLGLQRAIEDGYQFVATMDADASHDPRDLVSMWQRLDAPNNQHVGVIIGSRYVAGGRIVNWPISRRLASLLANFAARWCLGLPTRDNTSAFRIYRTSDLKKIELRSIRGTGYAYLEEILFRLHRAGVKMLEAPITFRNRERGKSKATVREAIGLFRRIGELAIGQK